MIDTRKVGQELQDQILAAARKGQQRVNSTVKTVTATAALIRPQLPSLHRPTLSGLPRPTLTMPVLPTPAQIREKAPTLVAMLPSTGQLMASAHELAGQILSVQRKVAGQVRSVTTPLAQQAAAVFGQVGMPTAKTTPAAAKLTEHAKTEPAKTEHAKTEHGKTEHGKAAAHRNGASTRKPRAKTAAK